MKRLTFESLYEAHLDDVWRVLSRFGVPDSQLEDAVQDTFIVAHRQLNGFRGESSARTWLIGIAVRVAHDVRRYHQRKGGLEPLASAEHLPDDGRPDEAAMNRQALRQVLAVLEALPAEQRDVMVLMDLEGFSAPEVVEATGLALNTVYSRLRLGRERFSALVEQQQQGSAP